MEAGTEKLHQSFVKTAYHGELFIQDGAEQNAFKFEDQYENPDSSSAASYYKWVKSITDIQKDPTWESSLTILSNRASGIFNVNLTKSGNDITGAAFTDSDLKGLYRKYPATTKDSEAKLAAVSLINLYFDADHQKTIEELDNFAKIDTSKDVTGRQIVEWYKSLGFACDTSSGKLTKDLTKSLSSSGKLYLTTYKATDQQNNLQQLSDEVLFQNIDLFRAQDVMRQLVSSFGRETTIDSKTHGSTFGYAFSLGASDFMRARRNKTTKITTNMSKAKAFSDGVDDIISARDEIGLIGIGTAVFMALYIALQFIPVANWVSNTALGIINLVTGGGLNIDTGALAIAIYYYYTASQSAETAFNKI